MSKFGLTEKRYNQMMASCNNDEEWVEGIVGDWGVENCNNGYAIFDYDGTGLLELCKIDDVDAFESDYKASIQAKKDGISIIHRKDLPKNMPRDMTYHRWIDTEENRKNLASYIENMRY